MKVSLGSIELGAVKVAILRVAAKVNGESLRNRVSRVLDGHIARFSQVYAREVSYIARKYEISWDEAFALLASDRPSPFKTPYTEADLEWARKQTYLVKETDLSLGGGLGIALQPGIFGELVPGTIPADVAVALEEGLKAGLAGKKVRPEDFSAFAIGCTLAGIARTIIDEESKHDRNVGKPDKDQDVGEKATDKSGNRTV